MLQETQTKLRDELGEQDLSAELRGRIRAQIDAAGIEDARVRKADSRGGLIPRRYFPLAIALSTVITVVALFPMLAHIREKARQATMNTPEKQIGLAQLQYLQDYDEKFPVHPVLPANKSLASRTASITLKAHEPELAEDAILAWEWSVDDTSKSPDLTTITILVNAPEINRLLPRLEKLGKTDARQIRHARALAAAHPSDEIDLAVRIIPEATK